MSEHPELIAVDALGPWLKDDRSADGRQVVVIGGNRAGLSMHKRLLVFTDGTGNAGRVDQDGGG